MIKLYDIERSTYISSGSPTKNFGNIHQLYVSNLEDGFFGNESENRSLIYFNVQDIISYINFQNDVVYLVLNISVFSVKNENFELKIHPLTKIFKEGFSTELYSADGANWNSSGNENWSVAGGDFNNTIDYDYDLNLKENTIQINITDYLELVSNNTLDNNGLIIIGDENVNNIGFYSNDDPSGYVPKIHVYTEDYVVDGEIGNEYDPTSLGKPNVKLLKYNSEVHRNEIAQFTLNIVPKYIRKGTWIDSKYRFGEDVQYSIYDVTRGKTVVPFSDFSRVNVTDSVLQHEIDFSGYSTGVYRIQYKYLNTYSKKTSFIIND